MNFSEGFQANIDAVATHIQETPAAIEKSPQEQREIVRQSIEKISETVVPVPASTPTPVASAPSASQSSAVPKYLSVADPQIRAQVENLVQIAYSQTIEKAIEEAKKTSPFVLDALHDALVDALIPELKKRGVL